LEFHCVPFCKTLICTF